MYTRPTGKNSNNQRKPIANPYERALEKPKKREQAPPPPDSFTELPDYLKKTIQHEAKQIGVSIWEELIGTRSSNNEAAQKKMEEQMKKEKESQSFTPLNFEALFFKQEKRSEGELASIRNRLHKMVQSDTEKAIEARKKEEEERKKLEEEEEQRKQEEEEQERQAQNSAIEETGSKQARGGMPGQKRKKAQVATNFEAQNRKKG